MPKKEANRLSDLKKELDVKDTPSDSAAKVTSLQGSLDDKDKAMEKTKFTGDELSSRVITTMEALENERESHKEQVKEMNKEYDDVVDEGIKGFLDPFQNFCDHVEVFWLGIEIPPENMDM